MDKVFFPINIHNTHWTMAVAHVRDKRICYYDSMGSISDRYLRIVLRYLGDECLAKKGVELDVSEWELCRCDRSTTPQQENGSDCGVFSILFADFISGELPISSFNQSHIASFRRKICLSILKGKLLYDTLICR